MLNFRASPCCSIRFSFCYSQAVHWHLGTYILGSPSPWEFAGNIISGTSTEWQRWYFKRNVRGIWKFWQVPWKSWEYLATPKDSNKWMGYTMVLGPHWRAQLKGWEGHSVQPQRYVNYETAKVLISYIETMNNWTFNMLNSIKTWVQDRKLLRSMESLW